MPTGSIPPLMKEETMGIDILSTLPVPLSYKNLEEYTPLEYVQLVGTAGSGKSHSILALARAWQRSHPNGSLYVIDTENGIAKEYKLRFSHLQNLKIWHGECVMEAEQAVSIFEGLVKIVTKDDWLIVDSDTRMWSKCQDAAWMTVTGQSKAEYLSERLNAEGKKKSIVPQPDNLWQYALDLYRRRFRDRLINEVRLATNVLLTAGLTKESPAARGAAAATRRETAELVNLDDLVIDGHGETPRNADTIVVLSKKKEYKATVIKDRGWDEPGKTIGFKAEDFWLDFMDNCRAGE